MMAKLWIFIAALIGIVIVLSLAIKIFCRCPKGVKTSGITPLSPERSSRLKNHVETLAVLIGERSVFKPMKLAEAESYILSEWRNLGYAPEKQTYLLRTTEVSNLIVEKVGTSKAHEIVVIGAHYDSVAGSPGADDNASGVAALLEISRLLREKNFSRTLRFVAFVNEEPPFFETEESGSRVYAKEVFSRKEKIKGMLSLESLGYYSDVENSQQYPPLFNLVYPNKGNFIGVVGNLRSRRWVDLLTSLFRKYSDVPSECVKFFSWLPGISWSDHEAFWKYGFPAAMITDTAPYRYPYYHSEYDLPERIHYQKLESVVFGLSKALEEVLNL